MTDRIGAAIAVADAGPLIPLDELGVLRVLADYAEVWVPDAVWRELQKHCPTVLRDSAVELFRRGAPTIAKVDVLATLYTLHAGEREALALCVNRPGAILLTDDAAARLAAQALAVPAHGTLGILIRAVRRRQLHKLLVLELLQQLPQRSSLHIRPGLLTEIIRQIADTPELE